MADSIQDAIDEGNARHRALMGAAAIWGAGVLVALLGIWRASTPSAFAMTHEFPMQSTQASAPPCPVQNATDESIAETTTAAVEDTAGAMVFPADELIVRPMGVTEAQKP